MNFITKCCTISVAFITCIFTSLFTWITISWECQKHGIYLWNCSLSIFYIGNIYKNVLCYKNREVVPMQRDPRLSPAMQHNVTFTKLPSNNSIPSFSRCFCTRTSWPNTLCGTNSFKSLLRLLTLWHFIQWSCRLSRRNTYYCSLFAEQAYWL